MLMDNEQTVRRFVEQVINNGNFHLMHEVIHPNYVYHSTDQVLQGPDALKEMLKAYRSAFTDLHVAIDETVSSDHSTVISFTLTATHKGNFMGMAATGKRVKVSGMTLSHFENGKIVEEWELLDQFSLYRQLGMVSIYPKTETHNIEEIR